MTCKSLNFTLAGYVIAASEIQAGDGASFCKKDFLSAECLLGVQLNLADGRGQDHSYLGRGWGGT